jgi:hypothetical protein
VEWGISFYDTQIEGGQDGGGFRFYHGTNVVGAGYEMSKDVYEVCMLL